MASFDPESIERIDKNPLHRESDRGLVLLCASDLENALEKVLRIGLSREKRLSNRKLTDLFDHRGPLGTFSAKILISEALGVIDENLAADLNNIRKIRNIAAHEKSAFSLSHAPIKDVCKSLNHFEAAKSLRRYSLAQNKSGDALAAEKVESDDANESSMKGFGFLRIDKVRFILTVKNLEIELMKSELRAEVIAKSLLCTEKLAKAALSAALSDKKPK